MIELFKTVLPLFTSPRDYPELLRKLASFTFWQCYLATWLFRSVPRIGSALDRFEADVLPTALIDKIGLANLNASGFMISLIIAFLFYLVQLHNLLAKLFKIRERFDVGSILLPLAGLVQVSLAAQQQEKLRHQRNRMMQAVFYRYASSAKEATLVDKHDILQALLAWSWFWIAEEGIIIWLLAFVASLFLGLFYLTAFCAGILVFWCFVGIFIYPKLEPLARAEIEQIAADPTAKIAIRTEFNAL